MSPPHGEDGPDSGGERFAHATPVAAAAAVADAPAESATVQIHSAARSACGCTTGCQRCGPLLSTIVQSRIKINSTRGALVAGLAQLGRGWLVQPAVRADGRPGPGSSGCPARSPASTPIPQLPRRDGRVRRRGPRHQEHLGHERPAARAQIGVVWLSCRSIGILARGSSRSTAPRIRPHRGSRCNSAAPSASSSFDCRSSSTPRRTASELRLSSGLLLQRAAPLAGRFEFRSSR